MAEKRRQEQGNPHRDQRRARQAQQEHGDSQGTEPTDYIRTNELGRTNARGETTYTPKQLAERLAEGGIRTEGFGTVPDIPIPDEPDESAADADGGNVDPDPALDKIFDQMGLGLEDHNDEGEQPAQPVATELGSAAAELGSAHEEKDAMTTPPKTKAQLIAEEATRLAMEASANLRTPEEISEARGMAKRKRDAERMEIQETITILSSLPESTKITYLRAMQNEWLLGQRERHLNPTEAKTLEAAKRLMGTFRGWHQRVQRLFEQGFPLRSEVEATIAEIESRKSNAGDAELTEIETALARTRDELTISVESEELHRGFNAWNKNQEAAQKAAREDRDTKRKEAMTAFYKGTVPMDQAMEQGSGEFCAWVEYAVKRRVGDDNRLVPILDGTTGKPVLRKGLVKFGVKGKIATLCEKFEETRPPHIHVDLDRQVELQPDDEFFAKRGNPQWHEDVRTSLARTYDECQKAKKKRQELALRQEELAKLEAYLGAIEDQRTTTVSEVFNALEGKKGRKTGVITTNNPNLRMDARDPNSQKFHLTFSLLVGAKGVCHLGEWYSSNKWVDLSPLVGRDLVLGQNERGLMRLTDPAFPSIEGLEGDELKEANESRRRISTACGRVMGALLAEKSYEARHPAEKTAEAAKSEVDTEPVSEAEVASAV